MGGGLDNPGKAATLHPHPRVGKQVVVRQRPAIAAPPAEGSGFAVTLQNQLVQFAMEPPRAVEVSRAAVLTDRFGIQQVQDLSFRRPTYLPVLTVLLVVLVAASSTMSLFTQAIDSMLLGVGGLILAVWGVRSVLSPQLLPLVTAVDLALLSVILFLLLGLSVRVALHLRRRAEVDLLPSPPWTWRRRAPRLATPVLPNGTLEAGAATASHRHRPGDRIPCQQTSAVAAHGDL